MNNLPLQVRQGELGDPLYFDFIAFAQYATICAAFAAAPQIFQVRDLHIWLQVDCCQLVQFMTVHVRDA